LPILYTDPHSGIYVRPYRDEADLQQIVPLIATDLSEPYSIYTYRYFIYNWPKLCLLAFSDEECVGTIVCKLEPYSQDTIRGYIAMLAVKEGYRRQGIGSRLVQLAVRLMLDDKCDEVTLETEITNKSALALYERLGFCRDKRLLRYYLNGVDAFRLKLWLTPKKWVAS
uniref:N-terminal methionine N(alpha)-acetyltransferase NatC n=1 Tax=Echinostoma caproni TaxID=27848 RepID=A0A183AQT6_9TREM